MGEYPAGDLEWCDENDPGVSLERSAKIPAGTCTMDEAVTIAFGGEMSSGERVFSEV